MDQPIVKPFQSHQSGREEHILPVDQWRPDAVVATYHSSCGRVTFSIRRHALQAVVHEDDELETVLCQHLCRWSTYSLSESYLLAMAVSACQYGPLADSNRYPGFKTLVSRLGILELSRLNGFRKGLGADAPEITASIYFLTVLGRMRHRSLSLLYRVVPMRVNGGDLRNNNLTVPVPGKATKARVCFTKDDELVLRLCYSYRLDEKTYTDCEESVSFKDLNQFVFFKLREEGREAGQILDLISEVPIRAWCDKWSTGNEAWPEETNAKL